MTKPPAPPAAAPVGIPEVRCGKAAGPGEQLIPCQERNVNSCYITGFASRRALPTAVQNTDVVKQRASDLLSYNGRLKQYT